MAAHFGERIEWLIQTDGTIIAIDIRYHGIEDRMVDRVVITTESVRGRAAGSSSTSIHGDIGWEVDKEKRVVVGLRDSIVTDPKLKSFLNLIVSHHSTSVAIHETRV